MRLTRRSTAKLLLSPALILVPRRLARASGEPYPAKPVPIIIPYPAGGPYDGIPRLIAQWIGAKHGWSIVMDNRAGATGILGVVAAKQAAPDGHTLVVVTTSTHGSMPALKRSLSYDPVKDFAPIVLMADAALVLLVRDDVPVRSVAQLVEVRARSPVSSIIRPAAMGRRTISRPSPYSTARACRRTRPCTCRSPGCLRR